LKEQMRNIYRAPERERKERTDRALSFVRDRFTWEYAAERHLRYCMDTLASKEADAAPRFPASLPSDDGIPIGFVTTWNTRCGIAEYTRYLATSLDARHPIAIFANSTAEQLVRTDEAFVSRCWEPWSGSRQGAAEVDEL